MSEVELDEAAVAAAEKLLGLELEPGERTLLLETLPRTAALYRKLRELDLPNGLGPATGFDPRLPGMEFDTGVTPLRRSPDTAGALP